MARTTAAEIADFYHQLALLVRSDLPLPDSLRQLSSAFPKADFRAALGQVADRVGRGEKLGDVVGDYPRYFSRFHAQLIVAGESAGTLSEILFSVARLSRFSQVIAARLKDVAAYPLLTFHLCLIVVIFLAGYLVPAFDVMYTDLLEGLPLPMLTALLCGIGRTVNRFLFPALVAYGAFLLFTIWLFLPWPACHRTLVRLIGVLPGSWRISRSLDAARLCTMLGAFIRQRMPLPEALGTASELVERRVLRNALLRVAEWVRSGRDLSEGMQRERSIDGLVTLTVRHAPEAELAQELAGLAQVYEHRVALAARAATVIWTVIGVFVTSLSVAFVVMGLFAPLVQILGCMC